jgi:hypothetical protein
MRRFLLVFAILISTRSLWAQSTDAQVATKASSEVSKATGILEISFPTGSVNSKIDSDFGSETDLKKNSPFSFGVGIGGQDGNNRGYFLLSFERLGVLSINDTEKNELNIGFKVVYDRTFKPWVTDLYLSGALLYIPPQGNRFVSNGVEFAPEAGLGMEASIGWISPISVAFNFGYKAVFKNYSYYKTNPVSGNVDKRDSSISYGGVFLTASIGRY